MFASCIQHGFRMYPTSRAKIHPLNMYPKCILHVSRMYPACVSPATTGYLRKPTRIHHIRVDTRSYSYSSRMWRYRVQPVGIRTSGCILLYPVVSWCIPEAHEPGHVWGGGYVYRSVFCMYPNVFHPLLKIHVGYIQNTPGYIKYNVSLSQTTGYKNTFQNTSEYTGIQYSRRIHQDTSEYIRILYS